MIDIALALLAGGVAFAAGVAWERRRAAIKMRLHRRLSASVAMNRRRVIG